MSADQNTDRMLGAILLATVTFWAGVVIGWARS